MWLGCCIVRLGWVFVLGVLGVGDVYDPYHYRVVVVVYVLHGVYHGLCLLTYWVVRWIGRLYFRFWVRFSFYWCSCRVLSSSALLLLKSK